jgi:hypothetical protein
VLTARATIGRSHSGQSSSRVRNSVGQHFSKTENFRLRVG